MALNKKDVTVLCPNGRRVNVKSTSSTSIGQIIEEACIKQELDPLNYNLKHLKRILDPSNTIQYSNIPNHAQLELVETAIRRQELNVVVNLATEGGQRLIHEFSSSNSLWDILTYHDSIEGNGFSLPTASSNSEPFIVYTMRKLSGEELKSVTLKSLGLYGGKCMMRYSTRVKEMNNQEKVVPTIVIVKKPVDASPVSTNIVDNALRANPSSCELVEAMDCDSTDIKGIEQLPPTKENETKKLELESSAISNTPENGCSDDIISATEVPCKKLNLESDRSSHEYPNNSHSATEVQSNEMECCSTQEVSIGKEKECLLDYSVKDGNEPVSNIIPLSDHNSILFSLDDVPPLQRSEEEEDDAFFELTTNEVRSLHREQMKIINEFNEAPLMTNKMRELEKDKRLLMAMNQFPNTQLRICFPDRLVIQANFKPRDTVEDVITFLRPLLIRRDLNFYLFTMFPRNILDPKSSLVDADCIPKARIYFGTEENLPSYLSEESLSKKSSFEAASKSLIKSRVRQSKDVLSDISENLTENTTSSELEEERSAKIKSTEKPKWFKLGK